MKRRAHHGFTIVELLIVIVVIAILGAITFSVFNGVQGRARDAQRKSDIASIAKLMSNRSATTSGFMYQGSTCSNRFEGFWNQTGTSPTGFDYGSKSAMDCLKETGLTNSNIRDPSGQVGCTTTQSATCFVYMYTQCANGTFIMAHLESEPTNDSSTDSTCPINPPSWDTQFGINYVVRMPQ